MLATHPAVEFVEPDYFVYPRTVPNDPAFSSQWGLRNPRVMGADIHAAGAWDIAKGAGNVVIAVMDDAIDIRHRDLASRLWAAPVEYTTSIAGVQVTCAQGSHGFWSINGELACDPAYRGPELHGTWVAGIAAAAANNGFDAAGVSWNSTLLPLTFGRQNVGLVSDQINAIEFAVQAKLRFAGTAAGNIRVINVSWGGAPYSQALRDEIARAGANDILFVTAAGNSQKNLDAAPDYPASFGLPNMLVVAASTDSDQLASFSNYGANTVQLAAPGDNIVSLSTSGGTRSLSGTSAAAPFVAGAAALVLSRCALDTSGVKALLVNSVDRRDGLSGYTTTGGRLNVETALRTCAAGAPDSPPAVSLARPLDRASYPTSAAIVLEAAASDTDGAMASVTFYADSTPIGTATAAPFVATWTGGAAGAHTLTAVATDDAGQRTTSNAVTVTLTAAGGGSAVPSPWTSADVGAPEQAGTALFSAGTFFVNGGGADVGGAVDSFQFVYRWLDGDGEIVAHLAAVEESNPLAKAGVMIRGSLEASAAAGFVDANPAGDIELVTRSAGGVTAAATPRQPTALYRWLKIARVGDQLIAFKSAEGTPTRWDEVGRATVALPPRVAVGLAVCGHDAASLTMARFDAVTVSPYSESTPLPFRPELIGPPDGARDVNPSAPPTLMWKSLYATSYDVRFGTAAPPPLVSFNQSGTSFTPPSPLAANTSYFWQIVARNSAGAIDGNTWQFVTGTPSSSVPPPSPWASQDIGPPDVAGSVSFANDAFTVRGGGTIWGTSDTFRFVDQPVSGDVTVVARLTSMQNTNAFAKAGVMIRESAAPDAAHVILSRRPSGDLEFMIRPSRGAPTTFLATAPAALPAWLRLTRTGTTITGAVSSDGSTWTTVGSTTLNVDANVLAGLAVCSVAAGTANTAVFDNVRVAAGGSGTLPPSWSAEDIGAVDAAGSTSYASGTFTVAGAGTIWGTADSFRFVHRPMAGDLTVAARLTGMQNTNTFAKAGVMIRESVAPGAAHVILNVRPTGDLEFMVRPSSGAPTTFLATAVRTPPAWLRLTRVGTTVTGSFSSDGSSWTPIGTATLNVGASVEAGLAVCSLAAGTLNTSTFDSVTVAPPDQNTALPAPWSSQDIGAGGQPGTASSSGGVFTVQSSGATIWGTNDGFHFVHQPLTGDGQIVARVTGITDTNTFAKAGIMIRAGLTADAAHVVLNLRPTNDIEFMSRPSAGAETTYLGGAVQAPPVWVKLVRTGSTVAGFVAGDDLVWQFVGSTTPALPPTVYVGLAVTSIDTNAVNASTFDNVAVSSAGGT